MNLFWQQGGAQFVWLEQLPPYAPDLNPDERVWQHPRCAAGCPLCGPGFPRHRRHGPGLARLCPAAHAHGVATLAPLALVGPDDRGRTGRQPAGYDAGVPTPARSDDRGSVWAHFRRDAAGRLPTGLRRRQPRRGGWLRVAGDALSPCPRQRTAAAALGRVDGRAGGTGVGGGGAGDRGGPTTRCHPIRHGIPRLGGGDLPPAAGDRRRDPALSAV